MDIPLSNEKREFQQRLRELRKRENYSQKQVAEILEIDRSTYSYYEAGKTEPNIKTLLNLADLYDVTVDYLLGRKK